MANERWIWDVTTTLEALGAADVALWIWEPERDRLRLTGAARALGLGPLAPDCSSAALRALALPQDRDLAEDMLQAPAAGRARSPCACACAAAETCIWRGVWLEEAACAPPAWSPPEIRFAASRARPR